jgi:hypothetical protein
MLKTSFPLGKIYTGKGFAFTRKNIVKIFTILSIFLRKIIILDVRKNYNNTEPRKIKASTYLVNYKLIIRLLHVTKTNEP